MKRIFLLSFFMINFCCAMDNSSYANGFVQGNQPFFCQHIYYPGTVFFNGHPTVCWRNVNKNLRDRVGLLRGINLISQKKITQMKKDLSEKEEEIAFLQKLVLKYSKVLSSAQESLRSKFSVENYARYLKRQNSFMHKEVIKVKEENRRIRNENEAIKLLPNFDLKRLLFQKDKKIKKLENENKAHNKEMYNLADYSGFKVSINAAKSLLKDGVEIDKVKANDNEVREPFFKL